ncbi:AraC family transcriptional regulator [Betaproteobacteria bacterium]|nr:AraC family transcriptional regulator [Betaproteobacteria bacterium]
MPLPSPLPHFELAQNSPGSSFRFLRHGLPWEFVKWHFHPEFELHMIVKTTGKLFVSDAVCDFYPGSLFLIGPYIPHNFASLTPIDAVVPGRDLVIQFKLEWAQNCMVVFDELKALKTVFDEANSGVQYSDETARTVFPIFDAMEGMTGIERLTAFFSILDLLNKCPERRTLGAGRYYVLDKEGHPFDKFKKAVAFIEDNLTDDIPLETVASHVNMSYKSFSNWFAQCSGIGYRRFLNRIRISKARELLYLSQQSIQEVGYQVGFNNISNFNKAFKALTDCTPTEFRERAYRDEIPNFNAHEFRGSRA